MNIYVGNLDKSVTEDEIKEAFEEFGEVASVKIIKDMYSGESKGFGFVEMPENSKALAAIKELPGKVLGGRAIKVSEARPRQSRGGGGGRRRGGGGYGSGYGGGYGGGGRRW